MDVEQGTSATLISQRTGATGGMTVTGGLATGFLVNNVTGPVSVSNSGYIVDVSSTTGDPVSGVVVTSGSSETVRFADAVVGGTDYKGDLIVTGSGFATGVEIGRAHVCTPVTNAHLVCRLLLAQKN